MKMDLLSKDEKTKIGETVMCATCMYVCTVH